MCKKVKFRQDTSHKVTRYNMYMSNHNNINIINNNSNSRWRCPDNESSQAHNGSYFVLIILIN